MAANDQKVIELCIRIIAEKVPRTLARLAAELERLSPAYDESLGQERSTSSAAAPEVASEG